MNELREYKDKYWLTEQYLENKLSETQIVKLCNCSQTTLRYWLKKFNIPIRPRSEAVHLAMANHCNLSEEARQWIDGELMGDGCLRLPSKYSVLFDYGSKYLEYINYVSNALESFGIKRTSKIYKYYHKKWDCYSYHYISLSYTELLLIYKRWYPKGKKRIPRDLKLAPLTLRQEYIGDGCLVHSKKQRPYIVLATYGFLSSDVNWIVEQLNKLGFKSTRRLASNTVHISAYSTKDFLDYIGKSPTECYNYKWKY